MPLLIVAGAGSGKTRVITYRIAHLLAKGVPQSEILAVTFTNKAAREMAQRVKELIPRKLTRLTVCTFHAFGAQVLREKHELLGLPGEFQHLRLAGPGYPAPRDGAGAGRQGRELDLAGGRPGHLRGEDGRAAWTDGEQAPQAAVQGVPEEPAALQRGGFRRPDHAAPRAPGDRTRRSGRSTTSGTATSSWTSSRTPRTAQYELMKLLVGSRGERLRRRRRRPVHLLLARGELREHPPLRAGLSRACG